ncbi:MAG: hypothetical protein L0206_19410, partial [Actinobacteria bacterium]|nr:hypothetical protein [Actinomycetota bacterium]
TSILCLAGGFVYLRGGSTPVPVNSAVERFRERSQVPVQLEEERPAAAGTEAAPGSRTLVRAPTSMEVSTDSGVRPRPAEGVYVYATTGGDEVDVLGGSRHTYPAQTTVTVRHAGCGLVERWDGLEERWDEREYCQVTGGEALKRTTSYHEFFGHADQRTLHCSGFAFPAGFEPGGTWSSRCASENTTATSTLTAVAWEDVDVGGVPVRTMHVHVETKLTGEQVGTSVRDVWGSSETGLLIRERSTLTSHSNQPVFGRTRYHEAYDNRLMSLEPRR